MERIESLWRLFWTRALSTEMTLEACALAVLLVFAASIISLSLEGFVFPMVIDGHPAPPLPRKEQVAFVAFVTGIPIFLILFCMLAR